MNVYNADRAMKSINLKATQLAYSFANEEKGSPRYYDFAHRYAVQVRKFVMNHDFLTREAPFKAENISLEDDIYDTLPAAIRQYHEKRDPLLKAWAKTEKEI